MKKVEKEFKKAEKKYNKLKDLVKIEEKKPKTKSEKEFKRAQKKKEKKFKKLKKLVASELFHGMKYVKDNQKKLSLIEGITKSVGVHKTLTERDREKLRNSESFYYDDLFTEFKALIKKHNERLQFDAEDLMLRIGKLQTELSEKVAQ